MVGGGSGGGFHVGDGGNYVGDGCDGVVAKVSVYDQVLWWIRMGCLVSLTKCLTPSPSVTNY